MKQENIQIFMKWKNPEGDLKYLETTIITFLSLDFYSISLFLYQINAFFMVNELGKCSTVIKF